MTGEELIAGLLAGDDSRLPFWNDPTTRSGLRARVDRCTAAVRAVSRPGDRVLVPANPSPAGVAALLGVIAAGRTAVPVPADGVGVDAAVHVAAPAARVGAVGASPLAEALTVIDPDCAVAERGSVADPPATEAVLMLLTSGTTGNPKGVTLTACNIAANVDGILRVIPFTVDDRVSLILPLHYSYGMSVLLTALAARAQLILHQPFVFARDLLTEASAAAATVLPGVPHHVSTLLRDSNLARAVLPDLRLVMCAGGALPPARGEQLQRRLPGLQIAAMYGQTEATARISILPPSEYATRPGSVGRGLPDVSLSVRDGNGRPVQAGQVGELYADGPNIMLGYHGNGEATRTVLTVHGLKTGDLATRDEDGYVFIVGRIADFAKIRGVRVSFLVVEEAAEACDGVVEACAMADIVDGEETLALEVVVGPGSPDVTSLRRTLARALPASHRPDQVIVVNVIPRTASGKKLRWRAAANPFTPTGGKAGD